MTMNTATITPAVPQSAKQRRADERKRLKVASLHEQLAWWSSPDRRGEGFKIADLRKDAKRVQKQLGRLASLTPTRVWFDDARNLPLDRGGQFPPCDENGVPLMFRARGETIYYPRGYITTSGHSYEVYLEAMKTGTTRLMANGKPLTRRDIMAMRWQDESDDELPDGYNGSRVLIYELHQNDRARVHRAERRATHNRHGERLITNVF